MTEITVYAPGTPCWVELSSPDLDASIEFYGALFGWDVPESENAEQTGGYRLAQLGGSPTAGLMPQMQEGQPTAWNSYVSVEDAEEAAAAVRDAGGNVIAEPMDVMDLGKMAVFTDPSGAVFGVWQPGTFAGAGRVNEPGAITWNELNTRDIGGAKAFYDAVFDWDFEDLEMEGAGTYTSIKLGDHSVGGVLDMNTRGVPEEVPPHWQVYFAVEDTDATVEETEQRGGETMVGPVDIPAGRFAVLKDPQGASFAVIALSEEALENA